MKFSKMLFGHGFYNTFEVPSEHCELVKWRGGYSQVLYKFGLQKSQNNFAKLKW